MTEERPLLERALDVFVYAPAGLVLSAQERPLQLPDLASKGRQKFETQIKNARLIGQFSVSIGRRYVENGIKTLANELRDRPPKDQTPRDRMGRIESSPEPAADDTEVAVATTDADHRALDDSSPSAESTPEPSSPEGAVTGGAQDTHLAIPDYAALSASQVVRRLEGLGTQELEAVYNHEATGRRRRTILHRAQQLLGNEQSPGTEGAEPSSEERLLG